MPAANDASSSTPWRHPAAASQRAEPHGEVSSSVSTLLLHSDEPDIDGDPNHAIAPDVNLSTTYRTMHPSSHLVAHPEEMLEFQRPPAHIYSRYTSGARQRAEQVLSKLMRGHAVTYASGLNAAYAVAVHTQPTVIALRRGYFGCHEAFNVYAKTKGNLRLIDLDDEYPTDGNLLVWLETPLNPSGEARNIRHYADRAHKAKGKLAIDSTFAPPPLQYPFDHGADIVMHSGTKYLGGHSDLLMGVVAVKDKQEAGHLWHDRTYMGSTPGNFECWLLLRSLRTLDVRVAKQSQTAQKLASWLWTLVQASPDSPKLDNSEDEAIRSSGVIGWVTHGSLQPRSIDVQDKGSNKAPEGIDFDPRPQMPGGFSPTFAIRLHGKDDQQSGERGAWLPHQTQYWIPATSLGGVESLIEHRIAAEPTEDPGTVRLSVGLEDFDDLQADLRRALLKTLELEKQGKLSWRRPPAGDSHEI